MKPGLSLHRYSIAVAPEAKGKKLAQMIENALLLSEFNALRPGIFTDFAAVLLSAKVFPADLLMISVPYVKETSAREPNDANTPSDVENLADSRRYQVRFDYIRTINFPNASDRQEGSADQGNLPMVQDLDIVLGHHRKLSPNIAMIGKRRAFQLRGREAEEYFLDRDQNKDRALLVALRGYFSSVRLSTNETLVNLNVSHGAFYVERPLSAMFESLRRHSQVHDTKIPGLLKGLRVGFIHLQPKTIIKTISGYASPGQGNGYDAHPPRISAFGAGPRKVEFFEYKSAPPSMGPKEKELAKDGGLIAHDPTKCGCTGSYISVYDYFKKSRLIYLPPWSALTELR